jgi:23S rRNA (adenine1618-N6)-methyltransferase
LRKNPQLSDVISLQQQTEPRFIFKNIITPEDRFTFFTMSQSSVFIKSLDEATKGTEKYLI